ncbi:hypothetical protein LTR08_006715 [Meristemomyces frigidus]|nr:hypothetical protein LTR08_006715 [Meristemomyces frigidus]
MGLGVLNDTKLLHVPGTATLDDFYRTPADGTTRDRNIKRSSDGGVILVPQPSDDPNNPLNWPLWRRDLVTCILCLLSVLASILSPLLAADTLTLTLYFERSFTDIALLTGYHLLGVGLAGFIFVASAWVWGKRHLYLLGTVIIIISSAWGGASGHNYNSLLAARFFQGVGLAPFEALVNASVGDLYFVHERGSRMALSNLSLFGGAFFMPVIVGKLTTMFPLLVLFVPETTFEREQQLNTDTAATYNSEYDSAGHEMHGSGTSSPSKQPPRDSVEPLHTPHNPQARHKSLSWASISPFNGRHTHDSFSKLLLRPFPLFLHPGILWACLIQGTLIGWTVLIGVVLAAIIAFIGALLGFVLAGLLSDSSAKWMTRRNGGIYEPEFRMVLVIPQLVFGCAGLYGFGITANNTWRYGWFWPEFFFALEVVGMINGAVASALYIVDAHRDVAVEAFTCLLVFKNTFSFGLTFSGYNWLVKSGIRPVFVAIGSVQVAGCCLTVVMYVFGKKNRSFFARHDILKMLKLR